jgi:glutamate 5-kinase
VRLVAKIGTSSITDERGVIDRPIVDALAGQIATLRQLGHQVVLVSSGAVSAGVSALGLQARPADLLTLQALSAAGQSRLMQCYNDALGAHGLVAAQALLVANDFVDRRQYLHARRMFERLFELGCVIIVNENDAVAGDESRYGDNDRIAALIANNLAADVLVLLTDTEGLFTDDPRRNDQATLITRVAADDPLLSVQAGATGSRRGSGGMASKLSAARLASWSGTRAVIAKADRPHVLVDAAAGHAVGTTFEASARRISARKLWIGFASGVDGTVVIDRGAAQALIERGTSLLPAGVVDVSGQFDEDAVVEVRHDGHVIARGMAVSSAATIRATMGKRTSDLPSDVPHEVIHRDDLVLIAGSAEQPPPST